MQMLIAFVSLFKEVRALLQRPRRLVESWEFEELFREVAGHDVRDARRNRLGWVLIPKEADLVNKGWRRDRLAQLIGDYGWYNNLTDDQYDGWWVRLPA